MRIYKCDGIDCEKTSSTINNWLTIGTESGKDLIVENGIDTDRAIISMSCHHDLHFCTRKCFYGRFFKS